MGSGRAKHSRARHNNLQDALDEQCAASSLGMEAWSYGDALRACFKTASLAIGVTTANLSRPIGARRCLVGACNVRDD